MAGFGVDAHQVAQIELPSWSHGRVALAGDAAYAVSLLTGQGANPVSSTINTPSGATSPACSASVHPFAFRTGIIH